MRNYVAALLLLTLFTAAHGPATAQMLTIHYNRPSGDYQGWKLWVWDESDKKPGFDSFAVDRDTYGLVFRLNTEKLGLEGKKIGLLPRKGNWADKDEPDRYFEPSAGAEVWLAQSDRGVYAKTPATPAAITAAYCDAPDKIRVIFYSPENHTSVKKKGLALRLNGKEVPVKHIHFAGSGHSGRVAYMEPGAKIKPGAPELRSGAWTVSFKDSASPTQIWAGRILDEVHTDAKLWAVFSATETSFSVFAPAAVKVEVLLKNSPQDQTPRKFALAPVANGLWTARLPGDLAGQYYRMRVERNGVIVEGVDPYAPGLSADGQWGMFVRDNTPVADGPRFDNSENIIYELHLRDISMDPQSGIKLKGKFQGLAEAGARHTNYPELATGLDHLKELGVNTLHILPVQEFDGGENRYDWGYMPWHFNAPEGSYATNPEGATRTTEFKRLVDTLHKNGFKVIMDVVYNHTAETGPSSVYSFNALAKDYYYRTRDDGSYYNGSGCGNEFRSDSPMGRKFLLDSLVYWATEYKVDGFRFDLMGLIDPDTMDAVVAALKKVNPNIFVYGEPWAGGDTPIRKTEKGMQRGKGYSVFNDGFRNAVKGSVFDLLPGYAQAGHNRDAVMRGIRGSIDEFTDAPPETINYVSCHDNHTLWDRINLTEGVTRDEDMKIRMALLAEAIMLTSQGIPFFQSGAELLRTKNGEHNTYNMPDEINRIDWARKEEYPQVFRYYRGLVEMRKAHPAFRLKTAKQARALLKFYEEMDLKVTPPGIAYVLDGSAVKDSWDRIVVLINPTQSRMAFPLPHGDFKVAADANGVNLGPAASLVSRTKTVEPVSMAILYADK